MTPSLVVFDLVGTLVKDDGAIQRCFVEALRGERLLFSAHELASVANLSRLEAIMRLLYSREGRPVERARLEAIHGRFLTALTAHYARQASVRSVEAAWLTLVALDDAGVSVAIETTLPASAASAVLDAVGWVAEGLVDAVVAEDDVLRSRPAPDSLLEAMRRAEVFDVRRVAKVGTTPADLAQGTLAGCGWVVGASYGAYRHDELVVRPHTHLVARLYDVLDVFGLDGHTAARSARRRACASAI